MIFCNTADLTATGLDSLACFTSQLRAYGLPAVISEKSLPTDIQQSLQFDLVSLVTRASPSPDDKAILISAQALDTASQTALSTSWGQHGIACTAFGSFDSYQSLLTTQTRLAYALGQEASVQEAQSIVGNGKGVPIFSAPGARPQCARPRLAIFISDLSDPKFDIALRALALERSFEVELVTSGKSKALWKERNGDAIPVWHLGEMPPRSFSRRFNVIALCDDPTTWSRFQFVLANLIGSGAVLLDCTLEQHWAALDKVFVEGTPDFASLGAWMSRDLVRLLPNLSREVSASDFAQALGLPQQISEFMPVEETGHAGPRPDKAERDAGRVLFVPTNGVGLGHAKRCSLVADALRADAKPVFAAFPSCIGMLTRAGFDTAPLVSRSTTRQSHANDLINTARLGGMAQRAKGLVFDGGYVFDSITRAVSDNSLPSVWIRRGLWQASQNNKVALDRQKHFTSIIAPEEAFDELNAPVSSAKIKRVGPIVHQTDLTDAARTKLRADVREEVGIDAERIVVTMLGGGVAADRTAQTNAIAAHLSHHKDVLNLIVTYPTAQVHPAWYQFSNTRVVRSMHAAPVVQAADLLVSAEGYNSFHEALYGGVPTIFVPQMASFMDDQRARAISAAERQLAVFVEPWDILSLTQKIDQALEGQALELKERLRNVNLPNPGTKAAAQHILEVIA